MATREIELIFPAAGLNRRMAFEKQSPFTTPQCQNVRSVDVTEEKRRGGSRPWLSKKFSDQLGSGNSINMLNSMRTTNTSGSTVFLDLLNNGDNYDLPTWANGNPDYVGTPGFALGASADTIGQILKTSVIPNIEQTATRTIYLYIPSSSTALSFGGNVEYWIHANMDDVYPDKSDSVECKLSAGTTFLELRTYVDEVQQNVTSASAYDPSASGWLSLTIGVNKLSASWESANGSDSMHITSPPNMSPVAGNAAGFTMVGASGIIPKISTFRIDYTTGAGDFPSELLMAASNGTVYTEKPKGTMSAVVTSGTLTVETEPIQSVSRLSKLYIADFAVPRRELTTSSSNVSITAAGVLTDNETSPSAALFTTAGSTLVVQDGDVIEITAIAGGDITTGWYKVTNIASDTVLTFKKLDGTDPGTSAATSAAYRIVPGLKVYDTTTDKTTLWISNGTTPLPYGCRLISKFRDAIMLAGDPNNEGVWYMSSVNDVDNWDESITDVRSAVFGTSTDSGYVIGSKIVATMSFSKDYHIVATEKDMWIFRGHPRQGGGIDAVSNNVGMVGPWSSATTDENVVYFLSKTGMYRLTEQAAAILEEPTAVSREMIPLELVDIDTELYEVFMTYDPNRNGIYIQVIPKITGSASQWFFDTQFGAFFPDVMDNNHQPLSMSYSGAYNDVLIGSRDGYIRYFDDAATSDDGTAQETNIDFGPFRIDRGRSGMVDSLEIVLDDGSDDVTWEFRAGQSPEEAFNATSRATGTISAGTNYRQNVRQSGEWGFLRLKTTAAARWSLERIRLRLHSGGTSRKI